MSEAKSDLPDSCLHWHWQQSSPFNEIWLSYGEKFQHATRRTILIDTKEKLTVFMKEEKLRSTTPKKAKNYPPSIQSIEFSLNKFQLFLLYP